MFRITADTNIYISALNFGGKPLQVLELARSGQIELAISNAIITEMSRILFNKFLLEPSRRRRSDESDSRVHEVLHLAGLTPHLTSNFLNGIWPTIVEGIPFESIRRFRREILDLAARHGARNVRVFGSVVRGDDHVDSDVDFLIDVEAGRTLLDVIALEQDLRELLGRKVEVLADVD